MLKRLSAVLLTAVMVLTAFNPALVAASDQTDSIPAKGGEVMVTESTFFNFSPNVTGFWMFETFENDGCDPFLTLYSEEGADMAADNDSAGDGNALIIVYLEKGLEYLIEASYYDNAGEYGLLAKIMEPGKLDADGTLVDAVSIFEIIPERNSVWTFRTSDNGDSDPVLWLYDGNGELMSYMDDIDVSGYDANSMITAFLTKGVRYTIVAGYYSFAESQAYTLNAEEIPLVEIDSGVTSVNGDTYFTFTPEKSFLWDIRTSNNDDDPILTVLSDKGDLLAYNDDSDAELNAAVLIYLEENESYIIYAGFYYDINGSCDLQISQASLNELPGDGGVTYVDASTGFLLTPEHTGLWEISAVKVKNNYPVLRVYDSDGQMIAFNNAEEGDIRALVNLEKGEEYLIQTELNAVWDSFNLRVANTQAEELPRAGGKSSVEKETYYVFKPGTSGEWEFSTSQNGNNDPYIWLYDAQGFLIAENDDKAGNFNALITEELTAGETYIIRAGFYEGSGEYTLNVSKAK